MSELGEILNRYANNEKTTGDFSDYSLEGINILLDALGRPDKGLQIIHVAGTNGKGSTCHMIESIYRSHGLRTGLYTSPHLDRVNERIRLNGSEIPNDDFLSSIIQVDRRAQSVRNVQMTYFDILTATALLFFKINHAEIVVLETGMGGRLDSTNAITPRTTVITPVDYDHTHILGDTLSGIAAEKAGIIKKGIPVITTNRHPDVLDVITNKAGLMQSPVHIIDRDFTVSDIESHEKTVSFTFSNSTSTYEKITINHPGVFQCDNAAAAIQASLSAGLDSDESIIRDSFSSLKIPGRMETLCLNPEIIFDPAHNQQAICSLSDMIRSRHHGTAPAVFLTLMKDKQPERIIELIRDRISENIYYITIDDPRAFFPDETCSFSGVFPDSEESFRAIAAETSGDRLLVFTGSFRIHNFASKLAGFFVDRNRKDGINIIQGDS